MEYKLLYHPDVLTEDIAGIPANIKIRIRKATETRLLKDPIMFGQPLRQSPKNHRKLRVGDWRIIYKIEHSNIIILKIGNRKDIYQEVLRRI